MGDRDLTTTTGDIMLVHEFLFFMAITICSFMLVTYAVNRLQKYID